MHTIHNYTPTQINRSMYQHTHNLSHTQTHTHTHTHTHTKHIFKHTPTHKWVHTHTYTGTIAKGLQNVVCTHKRTKDMHKDTHYTHTNTREKNDKER
jgi:hypothetical protein